MMTRHGAVCFSTALLLCGCAGAPTVSVSRSGHTPSQVLRGIPSLQGSYHTVRPRETLWRIAMSYGLDVNTLALANGLRDSSHLKVGERLFIPIPSSEIPRFLWPVRGTVQAAGATALLIDAPAGNLVRASRSGRVAVATRHLAGLGKTLILDHHDGYFSIYAGLGELLVMPQTAVRQGTPIGSIGSTRLHFEIRHGEKPKNTLALLPLE